MEGKEAEGRPYLYGGSHVGGRMRAVLLRTPSAFTSALNTPRQMTVSRLRLARSCLASDTTSKAQAQLSLAVSRVLPRIYLLLLTIDAIN